jgi:hypothetical protein
MIKINRLGRLALLLITCFLIGSCASAPKSQKSNLTIGTIKKNFVKGSTTQTEVIQLLGSPNMVTRNAKNQEVWTYSRQSFSAESGSSGGGFLFFWGSSSNASSSTESFDLIITFNKKDVVSDYSVVSAQF